MIDLEHPRFELLVEHDVEAEQLKAAIRLLGLAAPVDVLQLWLDSDNGLDDDGLNLVPNLTGRPAEARFALFDRRLCHDAVQAVVQTELVGIIVELVILFIQRVIGQVGIEIAEVLRRVVLFRCEPHQAILV